MEFIKDGKIYDTNTSKFIMEIKVGRMSNIGVGIASLWRTQKDNYFILEEYFNILGYETSFSYRGNDFDKVIRNIKPINKNDLYKIIGKKKYEYVFGELERA